MADITLAQAQAQLDLWVAADAAVASGKSYSIGTRRLDRVDGPVIRERIGYWRREVIRLSRSSTGGMRVTYGGI
jgi:hypothetical protein